MDEAHIYILFGRRVAAERARCELSQQKLGERVGLSRASIANIEAGRQRVLLHQAIELAHALRIQTISDLIPLDVLKAERAHGRAKDVIITGSSVSRKEAAAIADIVASS